MKVTLKHKLMKTLKVQGSTLAVMAMALNLSSCQEEAETSLCSDSFLEDYQSMQTQFKSIYKADAGASELASLQLSLETFMASHKDVECIDSEDKQYAPTKEVEAFAQSLVDKFAGTTLASVANEKALTVKVVYGEDNRVEVSEASEKYQQWAASTAAMMTPSAYDSNFNIVSSTLGKAMSLCSEERFYDQFSSASCSGFLVGPDTLVTAGHCINESSCGSYNWVFGFTNEVTKLDPENIYDCKEVISSVLTDDGQDYAVVKLDRKVTGRKFFRVRSSGSIEEGADIVVIGHPSGLPTKVADGATVRDSSHENFFVTDLDTFGGNSGSVVINQSTGVAEGILVRGDTDYNVVTGSDGSRCREVNVCTQNGCNGEDVTKMSIVEGLPGLSSFDEVYAGIFEDQSYPEMTEGLAVPYYGTSFGDYSIGGVKFLELCGIHYFKSDVPSQWESSFVGECTSNEISAVVSNFSDLFYF